MWARGAAAYALEKVAEMSLKEIGGNGAYNSGAGGSAFSATWEAGAVLLRWFLAITLTAPTLTARLNPATTVNCIAPQQRVMQRLSR